MDVCKVTWNKDFSLAEVYTGGLQMALCSPPDENGQHQKSTTFVTCKDFFQDAVQAFHLGQKREIYDFKYDPKTAPPLSLDRCRILLGNTLDKDIESKIENVLDFVGQFEKRIKLLQTKAFKCDPVPQKWEKSGVYMFEGSSRWMISPPMLSLYTLLLRCGLIHTKGEDFDKTCEEIISGKRQLIGDKGKRQSGCYDDVYLKNSQPGIKSIVEHGYARLFYKDAARNYPNTIKTSAMHDRCGIVGFSQKKIKEEMPYWYRLVEPKIKKPVVKDGVVKKKPAVKKPAVKSSSKIIALDDEE
jgi:hypothetical protein